MLIGIGLLALVTGAVAEQFVKRDAGANEETVEQAQRDAVRVETQLRELNERLDHLEALIARERD